MELLVAANNENSAEGLVFLKETLQAERDFLSQPAGLKMACSV